MIRREVWWKSLLRAVGLKRDSLTQKIEALYECRNSLEDNSNGIYSDIKYLEEREQSLVKEGKDSSDKYVMKRLATQIARLRKSIGRQHTKSRMVAAQINIIDTHLHNLSLSQHQIPVGLPGEEELAEAAAEAEETVESLEANDALASTLTVGMAGMSEEEKEIMAELSAADTGESIETAVEPTVDPFEPVRSLVPPPEAFERTAENT